MPAGAPPPGVTPPPLDNGIVASSPPSVVVTPDGWTLSVMAGEETQLPVAPLTTALMVAARSDAAVDALPDTASDEERALVFAKAIARRAVSDWEGVGDADGVPVPLAPAGIDALLEVWPIFEAFQATYVSKGLLLDAEKNA